jgi:hypothetical protein
MTGNGAVMDPVESREWQDAIEATLPFSATKP